MFRGTICSGGQETSTAAASTPSGAEQADQPPDPVGAQTVGSRGKGMTIFRADLLKGKRILVTGGGTGLGREIADEYARLGAEVYICGRRGAVVAETARELAETHNTRVTPIECDIRLPDAVENMMTRVFDEGPLTGLVNNAAGNFISRTKDLSPNGFNAIASIVFHGTFYVTLAAGKRWIEARQQANDAGDGVEAVR